MKAICLICARGGSKGVPKKNIRNLAGKPLIAYSIEMARRSQLFTDIVISTDDPEIAEVGRQFGARVPFMRPPEMASDTAGKLDAMHYTIRRLADEGVDFDYIIDKDPTVPFLDVEDLRKCATALTTWDCDTVVGVTEPHINPYFNMVEVGKSGFLQIAKTNGTGMTSQFLRRQDAPPVFNMHGLIGLKRKVFLEQKKVYSDRCLPLVCDPIHSIMIDYEIDFQFCEFLMARGIVSPNV